MRKVTASLVGLVLASIIWILVPAGPARACLCAHPPESEQALLERADVVFEGVPVAVRDEDPGAEFPEFGLVVWQFDVDRVLKGAPTDPQEIETGASGVSCGFRFEAGVAYQIFATARPEGGFSTGLCTGTKRLSDVVPESTSTMPTVARPPVTTPATTGVVRPTTTALVAPEVAITTDPTVTTSTAPPLTSETELADSDEGDRSAGAVVAAGAAALGVIAALGYLWWQKRRREPEAR